MAKSVIAIIALIAGGILAGHFSKEKESAPFEPGLKSSEANPIPPWIDPQSDMGRFFPGATEFRTENYPLSAQQAALAGKLGRPLEPGENLLTSHRVYKGAEPIGAVIVKRVKGENGAIDVVVAISEAGSVIGHRIQRSREPEDEPQSKVIEEGIRSALILYEARQVSLKPHH